MKYETKRYKKIIDVICEIEKEYYIIYDFHKSYDIIGYRNSDKNHRKIFNLDYIYLYKLGKLPVTSHYVICMIDDSVIPIFDRDFLLKETKNALGFDVPRKR